MNNSKLRREAERAADNVVYVVRDLITEIDSLENDNDVLKAEIDKLNARLNELENDIQH